MSYKNIAIIILIGLVIASYFWGAGWMVEAIRHENNFLAERTSKEQERQVRLKEFKMFYDSLDVLNEKLGLKPKQVNHYIAGEIIYRDTGTTKIIHSGIDTVKVYPDSLYGTINRPCYDLNWLLNKGEFSEELNYHDSLYAVMYRERPKKFLFIRYGKWKNKALLYSSCRDSVYKVFDNIKVIR